MDIQGKNLIISADDFGISKLADVNILALTEAGKIDRVAVMMSPNLNESEAKRLMASGVKIDIHLHLIKSDSDYWTGNRRLKEGAAKRMISFVYNFMTGKSSPEKVALKWAIQIERFREIFGRNPDGIGSHEYIHFFPPYMKAVLKLADKYKIPFVRMGKKNFNGGNLISKILNWQRRKNIKSFMEHKNISTTDYMASLDWFSANLEDFLKNLPDNGSIEMVCHPEREEELELLKEF